MSKGALTPRTYPYPMVRISCSKCDRAGRYRQQMLIDHYGPDIAMPDTAPPAGAVSAPRGYARSLRCDLHGLCSQQVSRYAQ
jgi:hypothetical protein